MRYRRSLLIVIVFAFISITYLLVLAVPRETHVHYPQSNDLEVSNRTRAFQVISAIRSGEDVRVSFKNGYNKTINAFTLSGGSNSGVQVDFTNSDTAIAPGATYNYRTAAASLEPSVSAVKPLNLTVLAVVFEDGTSDGEANAIADVKNRRSGEKVALARIIPLLDQTLAASDADLPAALDRLKAQISSLFPDSEQGQSPEIAGGILHGKGDVLGDIERLKQKAIGNIDLRDKLFKIKERYEKKSAKLK
jgi:hypothetical protein